MLVKGRNRTLSSQPMIQNSSVIIQDLWLILYVFPPHGWEKAISTSHCINHSVDRYWPIPFYNLKISMCCSFVVSPSSFTCVEQLSLWNSNALFIYVQMLTLCLKAATILILTPVTRHLTSHWKLGRSLPDWLSASKWFLPNLCVFMMWNKVFSQWHNNQMQQDTTAART